MRIDRHTPWGNPFIIGEHGDRETVIRLFRERTLPTLLERLGKLRGKVLICWCYPEACHGDVLCDALNDRPPPSPPFRLNPVQTE